jgi:hypothetical protein
LNLKATTSRSMTEFVANPAGLRSARIRSGGNIEGCPVDAAALRANASSFDRRHDPLFPQREGEVGFAGTREDLADALQGGESVGV